MGGVDRKLFIGLRQIQTFPHPLARPRLAAAAHTLGDVQAHGSNEVCILELQMDGGGESTVQLALQRIVALDQHEPPDGAPVFMAKVIRHFPF